MHGRRSLLKAGGLHLDLGLRIWQVPAHVVFLALEHVANLEPCFLANDKAFELALAHYHK
jgi:hypothetical protein